MIGPPLDYYVYANLFNFFTTGLFTFYVISKKPELKLARLFCIFSAEVAIWALFYFLSLKTLDRTLSEFSFRTCMVPVAFIPSSFFHFVTELIQRRISPWVHRLNYVLSGVTVFTIYTDLFATGGAPQYLVFPYWPKPGPIFPLHVLHFVGVVFVAHMFLLRAIHESSGLRRSQLQMVFWGMLIAFVSGIMNYLTWYKLPIPPILLPLVSTLVFTMGYAIVKHQLMDIRIILRRSLVYSLLVACITATYLVMVLVMEHWFQGFFGYRSLVATSIVGFAIALGFVPLKNAVQVFVDRYFFRGSQPELAAENERLRHELVRSEKLKAVATLAAGMAHEIKNPLASIKTFAEYLPQKYDDPAYREKFAKIMSQEVEKMNTLVQRLLHFARPSPPQLQPVRLSGVVSETLDFLQGTLLQKQIQVETTFAQTDEVLADAAQLKQALLNVLLNSLEAMDRPGRITISTAQVDSVVTIAIADTGPGIAKKDLQRVFDPFYTTKSSGTGLGLSVVHSIVQEHGGRVAIHSELGAGTRVEIALPRNGGANGSHAHLDRG